MDNIVLTENGLALRDKLNAGQTTATFTRFCTSSAEYDQSELGALTELKDSKLESAVTNLEIREDHTMVISGAVDNKSLQEGYYITLIGLYAKETDGEEILFAVSKVSSPMYMPEKSGALSGMSIRFSVKIENSDSINVTVDPTTAATLGDLNALRSEVTTPTFEDYESEESPALPALEDAMKQIKSGNTMRVILQNTKAAFKGLLNLVNAKVNQKDYDAAVSKLNGDISTHKSSGDHDSRYALKNHNHDSVYSKLSHSHAWSAITGKPSSFTPSSHTHDDRYFTESEVNNKLKDIVISKQFTSGSKNIGANDGAEITVTISVPSGYKFLGVHNVMSNGNVCPGYYSWRDGNTLHLYAANAHTWALTVSLTAEVLFIKS